jgi:hypothetical protein
MLASIANMARTVAVKAANELRDLFINDISLRKDISAGTFCSTDRDFITNR